MAREDGGGKDGKRQGRGSGRPAPRPERKAAPREGGPAASGPDSDGAERIAKRLARAGVASRREAERMIAEGRVRLNGKPLDTPAVTVTLADRIEVDGKEVAAPEPARLWRYHKPSGLVTTARDEQGRPTVFERLPPELPRVVSIGRLDLNSEGLLLLTNDGELKRRLELPSTGWLRKYRVRVHGTPDAATIAPLEKGIEVDGERFQPMTVTLDRQQGANAWLTIGLREGKNREIRRALWAVGLDVNRLIRISYGPFQLGDLATGGVEEVRAKVLADQLGTRPPAKPGTEGTAKPRRAKRPRPPGPQSPGPRSTGPRSPGSRSGGSKPSGPRSR
ncbi:MAG: pseudouridine synthase [Pseudomonadota bacterium]